MSAARIQELASKIMAARAAYYNSQPIASDVVFDAWIDELRGLDPNHPAVTAIGAPVGVTEWKKAQHEIPMGSLNKVNTADELRAWAVKCGGPSRFMVADKLDGLSLEVIYKDGVLVAGITRGDGLVGEDITSNVRRMKGIVGKLPQPISGSFRGEIVLLKSDHQKHFPDYSNPRNAASGIARRFDGTGAEHLTVIVYQAILDDYEFKSWHDQIVLAKDLGFIAPVVSVGDIDHILSVYKQYGESIRKSLAYEIDGLVVSVNDLDACEALGESGHRPAGQTAFKFDAERRETRVRDIEWSVGKTGRITPVAIVDPVKLAGATVERVSLHNYGNIKELGIDIGCKGLVSRANDVIPFFCEVTEGTGQVARAPTKCPMCDAPTLFDGEYLVCRNKTCKGLRVGRIQMWIGEIGILEWGEGVIKRLVESGKVDSIPDLYRLKVEDIANLDRLGEKTATKLLKNLWAATPLPLETIVAGLSIPLCQTTMGRLLVHEGKLDTVDKLCGATEAELMLIPGIAGTKAAAIFKGLAGNCALLREIVGIVKIREAITGNLTGATLCFTGSAARPRKELEQIAKNSGAIVHNSVGRGLTYLVIADPGSTTTKAQAARKYGTKLISEEQFIQLAGAKV